jgi:CRISPR-associated protein Csd1
MSWMSLLCKTYDNLQSNPNILKRCKSPLIPPSHTLQAAHIEIMLDEEGNFVDAEGIPKSEALTIVPCTESSLVRTSGCAPHALYDNLKYIAGDACIYVHNEKVKDYYAKYIKNLEGWAENESCSADVKIIYQYLKRETVMNDLIQRGILEYTNGQLTEYWGGDVQNKPSSKAKKYTTEQAKLNDKILSAFVRFKVLKNGDYDECNENIELMNSYVEFDKKRYTETKMCYIDGNIVPIIHKHSSNIRYTGDSKKLISSNDTENFTFRGRFRYADDAVAIGYEVSSKAHSALRWLIANQGFKIGEETIIIWSPNVKKDVLSPLEQDTFDLFGDKSESKYTPLKTYAENVRKAINGYKHQELDDGDDRIVIMIIDSATTGGKGRLSIKYYREFMSEEYFDNIEKWHNTCIWNHNYKVISETLDPEDGKKKKNYKYIKYTGAPSIKDIISVVYGDKINDNLKKRLYGVLTACVTENRKLPKDIMMRAVIRASNPQNSEKEYEIHKNLSITCALIKKYYEKENYDMALDYENKDRSYLFGRVLAYAERIESVAMWVSGSKHIPKARKLRSKFRVQPAKTWAILDGALEPYIEKLYAKGNYLNRQMQKVMSEIDAQDFMDDRPLEPTYLLGYACQMAEFEKKSEKTESKNENEDVEVEEEN